MVETAQNLLEGFKTQSKQGIHIARLGIDFVDDLLQYEDGWKAYIKDVHLPAHPAHIAWAVDVVGSIPPIIIEEPLTRPILQARDWRAQGGSIIVAFVRHSSQADQILMTELIRDEIISQYDPPDQFGWVLTGKYGKVIEDFEEDMGLGTIGADAYAQRMGFTPFYVYNESSYRKMTPEQIAKAEEINSQSFWAIRKFLRRPGTVLGLAFEGTRRGSGRVHRGIRKAGSLLVKNSKILPVILNGSDQIQPHDSVGFDDLNPFVRVRMQFGDLISLNDINEAVRHFKWTKKMQKDFKNIKPDPQTPDFTKIDALMMLILDMPLEAWMPGIDPRGVYAWENIVDLRSTNIEIYHNSQRELV